MLFESIRDSPYSYDLNSKYSFLVIKAWVSGIK